MVCVKPISGALSTVSSEFSGDVSCVKTEVPAPGHAAGDLDPAVIDRMDEALEFPLPSAAERKHIIALYLDQYIAKAGTAAGGAGTAAVGLRARLSALLRGQKASADTIRWRTFRSSPFCKRALSHCMNVGTALGFMVLLCNVAWTAAAQPAILNDTPVSLTLISVMHPAGWRASQSSTCRRRQKRRRASPAVSSPR